jgi:hypothetical protein
VADLWSLSLGPVIETRHRVQAVKDRIALGDQSAVDEVGALAAEVRRHGWRLALEFGEYDTFCDVYHHAAHLLVKVLTGIQVVEVAAALIAGHRSIPAEAESIELVVAFRRSRGEPVPVESASVADEDPEITEPHGFRLGTRLRQLRIDNRLHEDA